MVWFYQISHFLSYILSPELSIPLWSDFITMIMSLIVLSTLNFQSHYGLILSKISLWRLYPLPVSFNPTMVWFYRAVGVDNLSLCKLSIPLWSDFIGLSGVWGATGDFVFQSHYGLILSCTHSSTLKLLITAFNPTMVWFYHKRT